MNKATLALIGRGTRKPDVINGKQSPKYQSGFAFSYCLCHTCKLAIMSDVNNLVWARTATELDAMIEQLHLQTTAHRGIICGDAKLIIAKVEVSICMELIK